MTNHFLRVMETPGTSYSFCLWKPSHKTNKKEVNSEGIGWASENGPPRKGAPCFSMATDKFEKLSKVRAQLVSKHPWQARNAERGPVTSAFLRAMQERSRLLDGVRPSGRVHGSKWVPRSGLLGLITLVFFGFHSLRQIMVVVFGHFPGAPFFAPFQNPESFHFVCCLWSTFLHLPSSLAGFLLFKNPPSVESLVHFPDAPFFVPSFVPCWVPSFPKPEKALDPQQLEPAVRPAAGGISLSRYSLHVGF